MIENLIGLFDNELNNIETENDINLIPNSVLVGGGSNKKKYL